MATVYAGGTLRPHDPENGTFTYAMPLLEPNGSFHDSGFDDPTSDQRKHDITTGLAEWKDAILMIWYQNNRRVASDMEIVLFRGLLQAPEECISARLRQLFENDDLFERASNSIQSVTENFSDDTSFHSSENSGISSEPVVLYPWATADNSEWSEGGLGHESEVETQKNEHIEPRVSARSTIVPQTENAPSYYSNESHIVPVPAFQMSFESASDASSSSNMMNSNTPSLNTIMELNPATSFQYRLTSLDGCQVTSLYNADFVARSTQSTAPITTEALMRLVGSVIHGKRLKGCGAIRDNENQRGKYPCTLGCGRWFRTSCDLFRHEEIVYPQHFWFCFHCGDPHEPSERHLFTREDKIRHHIKHAHPDMISVSNCRIPNARTTFPKRCTLCLHHKHRTWKDRCKHIIMHIRRGEDPTVIDRRRRNEESRKYNGDSGDDGDDNDDDDGNDSDTEDEDDDSNENEGPRSSDTEGSSDYSSQDLPNFPDDSAGGDWSHGLFNFDDYCGTPNTRPSSSRIFLERVDDAVKFQPGGIKSGYHSIRWVEKINNKGATATMFKVNLTNELESTKVGIEVIFAVKQYQAIHLGLFKQELQAFKDMYANGVDPEGIVHCYGTFEYRDSLGQTYYNLLLEYAECDLREYWADTLPPRTATEITDEWSKLLGIARALKHIHGTTPKDKTVPFGWHGDIKPDNILVVDGRFKLADFGFATIQGSREHGATMTPIRGGTTRYRAPEFYSSWKAKSREYSSADAWSLGCVFSEAATWILMGFPGLQEFNLHYDFRISKPSRKSRHKVLRARTWHRRLRGEVTEHDLITANILDVIDNHLLRIDARERIPMSKLCYQLDEIIRIGKCSETIDTWLTPGLDKYAERAEDTLVRLLRETYELSFASLSATQSIGPAAVDMFERPRHRQRCPYQTLHLGAIKASIGHGGGASGINSLVKVLMMMKKNAIPANIGIKGVMNKTFPKDLLQRKGHIETTQVAWPRKGAEKRKIFLNNFSAAGGNTALLMEDGPPRLSNQKGTFAGTKGEHDVVNSENTFLVIDAGGGTSDITTFKTMPSWCPGEISCPLGFGSCSAHVLRNHEWDYSSRIRNLLQPDASAEAWKILLDRDPVCQTYKWDPNASVCDEHLPDVGKNEFATEFSKSRWFQRGWTLHELPAPKKMMFDDRSPVVLGSKVDHGHLIHEMPRIDNNALTEEDWQESLSTSEQDCSLLSKRNITEHEENQFCRWKCTESNIGLATKKEWVRHENDQQSATLAQYKCLYPPCTYASKREFKCKHHMEKAHGRKYVLSKSPFRRRPLSSLRIPDDNTVSATWNLYTAPKSVVITQPPYGAEKEKTEEHHLRGSRRGGRKRGLTAEQRSDAALMGIAGPWSRSPRRMERETFNTWCEACLNLVSQDELSGQNHSHMAKRCPYCHHNLMFSSDLEEIRSSNAIHRPRIKRRCETGAYSRPTSYFTSSHAEISIASMQELRRLIVRKYELDSEIWANMAAKIAPRLDQYLSGRQERPTDIEMWIEGDPDSRRSSELRHLFSEFWHSRRRRPFKHNVKVRFVVLRDIDLDGSQLGKLAREFPFVSIAHSSHDCNASHEWNALQGGSVTILRDGG
ncbi:hypothetical protein IQ07DRAFT_634543 [Pyrenochaeta sp. DS3sAY3a]|nr:hypothetical protein IQ07DRAFT_634543 [Pyrenochaeta sp. DS3sAY3a]